MASKTQSTTDVKIVAGNRVPRLHLGRTEEERTPKAPPRLFEDTNSFSLDFTHTSPRLEHRYRKRFAAADGTQNLAIEPPRMGPLSHRWSALETAWNRPFLSARSTPVPPTRAAAAAAAVRAALPVTGDFRNDSVFSSTRRAGPEASE